MVKSPSNRTTKLRRTAGRGKVEMAARDNKNLLSPKLGKAHRRGKCLLKGKIKKKMVKVRKLLLSAQILSDYRLYRWFCIFQSFTAHCC